MKTLLSVLGKVVRVVGVASGFIPLVQQAAPQTGGALDKLAQAFNVIVTTEQTFSSAYGTASGKGSDKLRAATPFVAQIIQQVELLSGKKPKNEVLFQDAATRMTSAMADILNSFEG